MRETAGDLHLGTSSASKVAPLGRVTVGPSVFADEGARAEKAPAALLPPLLLLSTSRPAALSSSAHASTALLPFPPSPASSLRLRARSATGSACPPSAAASVVRAFARIPRTNMWARHESR